MRDVRVRREPPAFRPVTVQRAHAVTPRMVRITLGGPELEGFTVEQPAASVRVLLPSPGRDEVELPVWNGNEFRLADGSRPAIRTFTPSPANDPSAGELDVEVVLHGEGVASRWAASVTAGAPAAVSGPGRGYEIDGEAPGYLLGGDETAIPAIGQLLEGLPPTTPVQVHVEISHPDARLPLRAVTWHELPPGAAPGESLVTAIGEADIASGTRIWVAGEAAAVQRIRRHLFDDRGIPRSQTSVRGYWKHGRAGTADD